MADSARNVVQSGVALRFAQVIGELNLAHGWGLDAAACRRYCAALVAIHPHGCAEATISRVVSSYHLDHELVQALGDARHHDHDQAWSGWMPQVIGVLHHAGLAWSGDGSIDHEDLAQVARLALARSVADYRYESRFSSWAFQVIVRSVRNELRSRRAQKRIGDTAYLAHADELELPIGEAEHPESVAAARLLATLANAVLLNQPDERLARIFQLWALEDRRVAEIGAQVGLSPARVRVLLSQIVELLRQDVRIRAWLLDEELRISDE